MEQKNLVGIVLLCLLAGFGGGYAVNKVHDRDTDEGHNTLSDRRGDHMMENGEMMNNMMNDGAEVKNVQTAETKVENNMDMMMAHMNSSLEGKTGDEFDKEFITQMIVHHQGAVAMAKLALTQSKHQEIKDLSQKIIDAQNKEITDMKGWLTSWYGQ